MPALPLNNFFTLSTSFALCTKDNPIQSTPRPQTNSKSCLSFSVKGARSKILSGQLTPFLSEIIPSFKTVHSIFFSDALFTCIATLPSSISSLSPFFTDWNILGCGRQTLSLFPSLSIRSKQNFCPASKLDFAPLKSPHLSFGPCRSARIQIGLENSFSKSLKILCLFSTAE